MSGSEPQPSRPKLAAIAFGSPFLKLLAEMLLARFGTGLELARVQLILPSARARAGLVEAMLAAAGQEALLLPRISAISQVDEEEAIGRLLDTGADMPPPPAMAPLARRMALARLLMAGDDAGAAAADRLARDLGRVVDLLAAHGVAPADLAALETGELATHRQKRLRVLETIVAHWPGVLAMRGLTDAVARREELLAGLAERWRASPPGPVVAAGFATAPPAVARLLGVIARLPLGLVVLPGLDPDIDEAAWARIGTAVTHPLFGLHVLLAAIGARPGDAERLGAPADDRVRALALAFRPAGSPHVARCTPPEGLRAIELPGPEREALAIALAMRRALEVPGRTAALVTRSRPLARRVAAQLARWDIQVDDSAGEPLALRPPGTFFLALLEAAALGFRPVALLAALKHPLAGARTPEARAEWLAEVRALDLELRGPAPGGGLAGIRGRIDAHRPRLLAWWDEVAVPPLAALEAMFGGSEAATLAPVAEGVAQAAGALAGDRLWAGPDGRALADLLAELGASADAARLPVAREEALALFQALLADVAVRPPWRRHPRLAILGPLEARLAHADLLILGDLNEGSWPAPPAPDPWLPPAARRALGLPPAEARIGLEAHDLLSAASAPEILLTRARRDDGGPTVPSRFLLRLQAAFGALPGDAVADLALHLDGTARSLFLERPAPAPPAAARPRVLRVTEADMLAADPFSFYARRMLGLKELDPLEQEVDGAVRGTVVHWILKRWLDERPNDPGTLVADELAKLGGDPALQRLWAPRVRRMLDWVRAQLAEDAQEGWTRSDAEVKLVGALAGIRIEGRADRIDRHADGRFRIIDYKTGSLPNTTDIKAGRFRQMPLLRLLVEQQEGNREGEVALLEYWKLSGGREPGERRKVELDRVALEDDLRGLLQRYLLGDAPFRPKVLPVFARQYRSFDQLARVEEWL